MSAVVAAGTRHPQIIRASVTRFGMRPIAMRSLERTPTVAEKFGDGAAIGVQWVLHPNLIFTLQSMRPEKLVTNMNGNGNYFRSSFLSFLKPTVCG